MGDWKQRAKKVDKRTKDKQLYKTFIQDLRNETDGNKRRKRQERQAKIREQDSVTGDSELEE